MALPSSYGVKKSLNSMEGFSAYENGGKGSGNFGHYGRPGYVGGSGDGTGTPVAEEGDKELTAIELADTNPLEEDIEKAKRRSGADKQEDLDDVLRELTGPRSNYCDLDRLQEDVQGILAYHAMENESILSAFEDEVRADSDLPSREERPQEDMSYGQLFDLGLGLTGKICSMGIGELTVRLGGETVWQAIHDAQIAGAIRYAQGKADNPTSELAQAKDVKRFVEDMDLNDRYGAVKRADDGDLRTAWTDLARELNEDFEDNKKKYRTV